MDPLTGRTKGLAELPPPPDPETATDEQVRRRNNLVAISWLMLPTLAVSMIVAFVLGVVLLGLRDLEGSEPMSEQGLYGWFVWALVTAIFLLPTVVGVACGMKARRLGAGAMALAGLLVNAVVLVGWTTVSLIGTASQ